MSRVILEAPPEQVYSYFVDNKRVHEYNEYCTKACDVIFVCVCVYVWCERVCPSICLRSYAYLYPYR